MATVVLENIRKSFGAIETIHGVNLDIRDNEFVVFVGPSGCGKSTLLRLIAGLEDISGGDLYIDDTRVNALPPAKRGIAMVFQSYALYPHMNVFDNMAFGLRRAREGRETVEQKVRQAAEILALTPLLDRLPKQLSGGQRQRVAIGRAIVRDPSVFLFDEPLSNLDAALRVATRIEIAKLHRSMDATMIYVTHDQVEAMTLADRIVVLNSGNVEQFGTPLELYHQPDNLFVATFLGSPTMNIIDVSVKKADETAVTVASNGAQTVAVPVRANGAHPGMAAKLGIRPEHTRLADPSGAMLSGRVDVVESLGESHLVHVDTASGERVIARLPGSAETREGETVGLTFDPIEAHLFTADGVAFTKMPAAVDASMVSHEAQPTAPNP